MSDTKTHLLARNTIGSKPACCAEIPSTDLFTLDAKVVTCHVCALTIRVEHLERRLSLVVQTKEITPPPTLTEVSDETCVKYVRTMTVDGVSEQQGSFDGVHWYNLHGNKRKERTP